MSFSPTFFINSESHRDVTCELQRIGLAKRSEIDKQTLKLRQRLRELELDYPAQMPKEEELSEQLSIAQRKLGKLLEAEKADAALVEATRTEIKAIARELLNAAPLETRKQRQLLDEEYATINSEIRLVWIKAGLVSISGGEFDGMTVEQLLDYGPIALAGEIYDALTSEGRLAGSEGKNSLPPGTSLEVDKPPTSTIIAASASGPDGIASGTASGTSLVA